MLCPVVANTAGSSVRAPFPTHSAATRSPAGVLGARAPDHPDSVWQPRVRRGQPRSDGGSAAALTGPPPAALPGRAASRAARRWRHTAGPAGADGAQAWRESAAAARCDAPRGARGLPGGPAPLGRGE
jgi:hypothetical protein